MMEALFWPTPLAKVPMRAAFPRKASIAEYAAFFRVPSGNVECVLHGIKVPRERWGSVFPKPEAEVKLIFTAIPAGGLARTLAIVVGTVALTAVAGPLGTAAGGALLGAGLGATAAAIAGGLVTAGISAVGTLALNALFGPAKPRINRDDPARKVFALSSTQNSARIGGKVPVILGKVRAAPDVMAETVTFVKGGDAYLRAAFCHGVGPLTVSNLRIGNTPVGSFSDVDVDTDGNFNAATSRLYGPDSVQENLSIEMEQGVQNTRFTASDASAVSLDFFAPSGLFGLHKKGRTLAHPALLKIEYRLNGAGAWTVAANPFTIKSDKRNPRRVTFFERFATPGRYEVRVTRTNDPDVVSGVDEDDVFDVVGAVAWTKIRSVQTGRPFRLDAAIAATFLEIRANGQLSGTVDNFTALVQSKCKAWNGSAWVDDQNTTNPGDLIRYVLQHEANKKAVPDDEIDLPSIQAFSEYCAASGWGYSRKIVEDVSVREILNEIAAAGRAKATFVNGKHTVIFDEESTAPVAHFGPSNSAEFSVQRIYPDVPHGFKVTFLDETADYSVQERIVYNDGYSAANATNVEQLDLPGITNPVQVYKFARYFLAEIVLRPERATMMVDWEAMDLAYGDRVSVAHDVLSVGTSWGRVLTVDGQDITVNEPCLMEEGGSYAIVFVTATGGLQTRLVDTDAGLQSALTLTGSGVVPAAETPFAFGLSDRVNEIWRVKELRRRADHSAELTLVNDAPGIYEADTGSIPAWEPDLSLLPFNALSFVCGDQSVAETVGVENETPFVALDLSWSGPAGVTVEYFEVAYQKAGEDFITVGKSTVPALRIPDVDTASYTFRITAKIAGYEGQTAPLLFLYSVTGEGVRPAAPTTPRIQTTDRVSVISVDPPVSTAQHRLSIRHSTAGSPTWESATVLLASGASHQATVPALVGTYLVKWVSPFGVFSTGSAQIVSRISALANYNAVEATTEEPEWPGAKVNCAVLDGVLLAESSDTLAEWTALEDVASIVKGTSGVAPIATYTTEPIDLGAVFTSRVVANITGTGYLVTDSISNWTRLDEVASISGVSDSDWSIEFYIRTTDDDVSGSPTWTEWQTFEGGDFTARGFQFRLDMLSTGGNIGVRVDGLSLTVDMPDRVERGADIAVGTSGYDVVFSPAFLGTRPAISVDLQGGAAGDQAIVDPDSVTASGAHVDVVNAAGTAISGNIDWLAVGYGRVTT